MKFLSRSISAILLGLLTLGLLIFAGYEFQRAGAKREASRNQGGAPQREREFSVTVSEISLSSLAPTLSTFGEIIAPNALELRTPIGGEIVALAEGFGSGLEVEKDLLLVGIDASNLKTALRLSEADLNDAIADVNEAEAALSIAREEAEAASVQLELRVAALERQNLLKTRGVGTDAALEAAELSASSAEQAMLSKQQFLVTSNARLERAKANVLRAEIRRNEADRDLKKATIYAPHSGVLSQTTATLGKLSTPNERLAILINPEELEVEFRLSLEEFARFQNQIVGQSLTLFDIAQNQIATGAVSRVEPSILPGRAGRSVFAKILTTNSELRVGDFVNIALKEPALEGVFLLPSGALGPRNDILLLGEDNKLILKPVTLLRRVGNDVVLRAQDVEGARAVLDRAPQLDAGVRVKPNMAGVEGFEAVEMVTLSEDEKAALSEAVSQNKRMPPAVRARLLSQIAKGSIKKETYDRLNARRRPQQGGEKPNDTTSQGASQAKE